MRISDWSSDVCSSDLFGNQSRSSKPIVHIERCRGLCTIERLDVMVEHIFEVERCEIGKHLLFGEVTPRFDADDGHETLLCTGKIGRASCRASVCPSGKSSVVAVLLKKKMKNRK